MRYTKPKNHIKEIVQMLGVELGEEFRIDGHSRIHRLTEENCMEWYDEDENLWESTGLNLVLLLLGKAEIEKIPNILTKEEKIILRKVIHPYRKQVSCILKVKKRKDYEFIFIGLIGGKHLELPEFENGTMFSGLKLEEGYSIEELGL